jgi:tetratricopeptide (TPR) repeat protein
MGAWVLTGANDPQRALEILEGVNKQYPNFTLAHYVRALAHLNLNEPAAAVGDLQTAVKLSGAQPFIMASLARAQARAGQRDQAQKSIDSLKPATVQGIQVLTDLASAYLVLGEKEQCYALLDRSVEENDSNPYLVAAHFFEDLYNEPKFIELVNRAGLMKYNPVSHQFELNTADPGSGVPSPLSK